MTRPPAGPQLIEVDSIAELPARLAAEGLVGHHSVIVVVGGASGLDEPWGAAVRRVIEGVVVPVAIAQRAVIVDGGTDSGVMRMVGHAHSAVHTASPPLVGVAVSRLMRRPGHDVADDAADLEPRHTHLVLVPGSRWGDESPWLSAVAGALDPGDAAVTVLLNGGEISMRDAAHSVAAGRPVVTVAGSGRAADDLAAQIRPTGTPADRPVVVGFDVGRARAAGLLYVLDASTPLGVQQAVLLAALTRATPT